MVSPHARSLDPSPSREPLGHLPALDGLRAVAVLAVVGFHARLPGFRNGDVGVDVFFTLSGFLITTILLASGDKDDRFNFRSFYLRRALRLLPAYCAVVIVCVLANSLIDVGGTLKGAAASFLYVANWVVAAGYGLGALQHTWSLSIEEQFYLVWPALLLVLVRISRTQLHRTVLVGSLVIISALITWTALALSAPTLFVQNATPTRSIELLFGCCLASALHGNMRGRLSGHARTAVAAGSLAGMLIMIAFTVDDEKANIVVMWPLSALLTCAAIFAAVDGPSIVASLLSWTPMVTIGKVSYGIYLWHYPVFTSVDTLVGLDSFAAVVVSILITSGLVWASYRFVERPFLKLKAGLRYTVRR